ncbi:hypothetical protein ON010_g18186 [Phytophthora cinnamomi]|nr:hypothetical protein ON010_g18186 [Phytophthora cinnamomi]
MPDVEDAVEISSNGDTTHGLRGVLEDVAAPCKLRHVQCRSCSQRLDYLCVLIVRAVPEEQRGEEHEGVALWSNVEEPLVAVRDGAGRRVEALEEHEDGVAEHAQERGDLHARHGERQQLTQVDLAQHVQRQVDPVERQVS